MNPQIKTLTLKRSDVNIIATLMKLESIHISDFNRLGKEIWNDARTHVVRSMACQMLFASGFGPMGDQIFLKMIQESVSDEAATKKALNLKGWVTHFVQKDERSTIFIAISTSGDGYVFDGGSGKCRYFIWNFEMNTYKVRG